MLEFRNSTYDLGPGYTHFSYNGPYNIFLEWSAYHASMSAALFVDPVCISHM